MIEFSGMRKNKKAAPTGHGFQDLLGQLLSFIVPVQQAGQSKKGIVSCS